MATKALIIGALPRPFEGPWIPISEGKEWEVVGARLSGVVIELSDDPRNGDSHSAPNGTFSAQYARAVIREEIPEVDSVSVEIRRLR